MIEIIVVKYNQPRYEDMTVESVLRSTEMHYHLTAFQNQPGVGLAKVWNQLIERSDADTIVLLNNDVQVTRCWLSQLHSTFLKHDGVGCVQPSSNAGHRSTISAGPLTREETNWLRINEYGQEVYRLYKDQIEDIPVSSAFCLMFPREVWESAGHFDEDFFLYGEDSEFSRRVKHKLGLRLLWRKDVYVHHYKARSVEKAAKEGKLDYSKIRKEAEALCLKKYAAAGYSDV
jgi:GT2 family glycosyltransferase